MNTNRKLFNRYFLSINYSRLVILLLIAATAGCSDDDDSSMQAPESAVNKALSFISGTIIESEPEMEEGVAAWKVEIRTPEGAEVEVYCRQDNGDLLRIDGDTGPFDYNIDPGNGLIDFSQAQMIAEAVAIGSLSEWRLRREDKYNNTWVYLLEYTSNKVYVSADDGSVLDIES